MNNPILDSTYFKYIPYDIREYIWNINYSWALSIIIYKIQKYIQNQKQIKIKIISDTISYIYANTDLGIYAKNYHIHCWGKLYSKTDVFNLVSNCKCCSRHQKNRPTKLDIYIDTESNFDRPNNCSSACMCSCRHLSRFICRSLVYENNYING